MSKIETSLGLNRVKRFLDRAYAYKEGVICFGKGESKAHFLKKCEVCWKLKELGYHFYVEARFLQNKGRADVLVLENGGIAIEIVASESQLSIDAKRLRYPVTIVNLPLDMEFQEEMLL